MKKKRGADAVAVEPKVLKLKGISCTTICRIVSLSNLHSIDISNKYYYFSTFINSSCASFVGLFSFTCRFIIEMSRCVETTYSTSICCYINLHFYLFVGFPCLKDDLKAVEAEELVFDFFFSFVLVSEDSSGEAGAGLLMGPVNLVNNLER